MIRSVVEGNTTIKSVPVFSTTNWYRYEAKRLIANIDTIEENFTDKKYISAEDIIDHVTYCKYGCHLLMDALRNLKRRLKDIEDQIKSGKWLNDKYTAVPRLSSTHVEFSINHITEIYVLSNISELIHNDLYKSYFIHKLPNIELTQAKVPHFPILPKESVSIKEKEKVIKLINDTIPYLNILEIFHNNLTKLINQTNRGLEQLLTL